MKSGGEGKIVQSFLLNQNLGARSCLFKPNANVQSPPPFKTRGWGGAFGTFDRAWPRMSDRGQRLEAMVQLIRALQTRIESTIRWRSFYLSSITLKYKIITSHFYSLSLSVPCGFNKRKRWGTESGKRWGTESGKVKLPLRVGLVYRPEFIYYNNKKSSLTQIKVDIRLCLKMKYEIWEKS